MFKLVNVVYTLLILFQSSELNYCELYVNKSICNISSNLPENLLCLEDDVSCLIVGCGERYIFIVFYTTFLCKRYFSYVLDRKNVPVMLTVFTVKLVVLTSMQLVHFFHIWPIQKRIKSFSHLVNVKDTTAKKTLE